MPIPYTRWKCKFKCGFHNKLKCKIEKHEEYCWYNPEKKGCFSCKHKLYMNLRNYDSPDERKCLHPDNLNDTFDDLIIEGSSFVPARFNCKFWEAK